MYNISNGHNGGLKYGLHRMLQGNIDLGIFQETKFTEDTFAKGVERIKSRGNRSADPALRRRCSLLPQGGSILLGGALSLRPKLSHISAGDREW